MVSLAWFGLVGLVFITILFFALRSHHLWFAVLPPLLIACGALYATANRSEWTVTSVGLLLYWFGLIQFRLILTRSVSLQLLRSCETTGNVSGLERLIEQRLDDGVKHNLFTIEHSRFALTPKGRFFSELTSLLYALTRQLR